MSENDQFESGRAAIKHGKIEDLLGIEVPENQAQRIIRKFGNARRLCRILKIVGCDYVPSAIYKWTYPKSPINGHGGRGGIIPAQAWPWIMKAAAYDGIFITKEDMDTRVK